MRGVLLAVLLLAGPVLADPSPTPPAGHAAAALAEGESWTAPAGGGVCLDLPAARYAVEKLRWNETRAEVAEKVAEESFLRGGVWGAVAGFAAGAAAAGIIAAARR